MTVGNITLFLVPESQCHLSLHKFNESCICDAKLKYVEKLFVKNEFQDSDRNLVKRILLRDMKAHTVSQCICNYLPVDSDIGAFM